MIASSIGNSSGDSTESSQDGGSSNGNHRENPELSPSTHSRPSPMDRTSAPRQSSQGQSKEEFFVEPEWQRAPGRWSRHEETLLREMKEILDEDLRAAPPFPEVVGSRRMLRFLRYGDTNTG